MMTSSTKLLEYANSLSPLFPFLDTSGLSGILGTILASRNILRILPEYSPTTKTFSIKQCWLRELADQSYLDNYCQFGERSTLPWGRGLVNTMFRPVIETRANASSGIHQQTRYSSSKMLGLLQLGRDWINPRSYRRSLFHKQNLLKICVMLLEILPWQSCYLRHRS